MEASQEGSKAMDVLHSIFIPPSYEHKKILIDQKYSSKPPAKMQVFQRQVRVSFFYSIPSQSFIYSTPYKIQVPSCPLSNMEF